MRKERLFWGLTLIFGAIILIVSKLGFLPDIDILTVLLTIFFVVIIVKSTLKMEFGGILFPLAFLCIMYDSELGIEALTPWTVLLAALLGSIGLSMIFPKYNYSSINGRRNYGRFQKVDIAENGYVRLENSFGTLIKYIETNMFIHADLKSSFGSMKIYLDKVIMQGEKATINIDALFSGVEIYVPKIWIVEDKTHAFFGGVDEKNKNDAITTNTLTITGSVSFSGVEIIYI